MPAIGTSSDQYQHRDPALTTYRRNMAAPRLSEAMAERSGDKAKAAAVERRQVEGRSSPEPSAVERRAVIKESPVAAAEQRKPEPVTPQRVLHELYAPPSRLKREHDDRHAMITGGTIDLRA